MHRIKKTEVNPYIYGDVIFDKGAEVFKWGEGQSFPQVVLGQLVSTYTGIKLDTCFIPYTEINSKGTIDLNVKSEAIKLLEENRIILCDLGLGKAF